MDTLNSLAEQLDTGRITARELTEKAIAQIRQSPEGERIFLTVEEEQALLMADHADAMRRAGRHPGRFAGIPISIKDLFDVAGQATRAGSVVLEGAVPAKADAPAIGRLRAAGLVFLGRTNMTEFAYSGVGLNPHYGTPLSVYDRDTGRIPGGSSSGAAVSVAEGIVPVGIGSDTGGSCRIPAAFNGITGYKPSVGRVPVDGAFPLSKTLDSVGPLAASVSCCAATDALMAADWDGVIEERDVGSLRFGIPRHLFFDDVEVPIATAFEASRKRLEAAGVQFVDVEFPELADLPAINANGGISAVEAYSFHSAMIERDGERYDQRVRTRIESGRAISGPDYAALLEKRRYLIGRLQGAMSGLDGLYVPTTPNVPPAVSDVDDDNNYGRLNFFCLRNTFVGNFLNLCAISLPIHEPDSPVAGGMIMARWGEDQALFSSALAVENVVSRGH